MIPRFRVAGIGHHTGTPEHILNLLTDICYQLAMNNGQLHTGNAKECDQACHLGFHNAIAAGLADVQSFQSFLPYLSYQKEFRESHYGVYHTPETQGEDLQKQAEAIAKTVHPAWDNLSFFSRGMHIRNVYQAKGQDLNSPVDFVLCYTRDGASTGSETSINTGGSATCIKVASAMGKPVFNLGKAGALEEFKKFMQANYSISIT